MMMSPLLAIATTVLLLHTTTVHSTTTTTTTTAGFTIFPTPTTTKNSKKEQTTTTTKTTQYRKSSRLLALDDRPDQFFNNINGNYDYRRRQSQQQSRQQQQQGNYYDNYGTGGGGGNYNNNNNNNNYQQQQSQQQRLPPVQSRTVTLQTWIEAEILFCLPNSVGTNVGYNSLTFREPTNGNYYNGQVGGGRPSVQKSPLVFLHGSYHAAWCWAEYYLPYFAALGYPTIALSLRGTSGSPAGRGVSKVSIDRHADDVASLLEYITYPAEDGGMGLGYEAGFGRPVLLGHDIGGLVVMKYLERDSAVNCRKLGGVALLCSVPPSGNAATTKLSLKRSLKDGWDVTSGIAMKQFNTNVDFARKLFFGGNKRLDDMGVSDEDIKRYQECFKRDSKVGLDLNDLEKKLPKIRTNMQGVAIYAYELPPCLCVGASDDRIVDVEGVMESATYLGLASPVFVESSHDIMLSRRWRNGADVILQWLESEVWG